MMLSSRAPASRPAPSSRSASSSKPTTSTLLNKLNDVRAQKPTGRCQATEGDASPAETAPKTVKKQRITDILKEPSKMKRRGLLMAGAASLFGCACCSDLVGAAKADTWKYDGGGGPYAWPGTCAVGQSQSPVNVVMMPEIKSSGKFPVAAMDFTYGRFEKVDVLNTGHGTMQVNFKTGNTVYVPPRLVPTPEISAFEESQSDSENGQAGGDCLCPSVPFNLDLIQYHFHTPSEHTIDGEQYVMEAHLVHRNKDTGGLAVIAVLMEPGGSNPNPCLQLGLDYAPEEPGQPLPSPKTIDPRGLLPPKNAQGVQPYIHYTGSLTTPPCSESVDFFVMTTPIKVTDKQAIDFMYFVGNKKTYAYNNRPVQPLNGRKFEYFEYEL